MFPCLCFEVSYDRCIWIMEILYTEMYHPASLPKSMFSDYAWSLQLVVWMYSHCEDQQVV